MAVVVYFVPMMIAFYRRHERHTSIFILNLFLGWAGFVWLVCLMWAIFGHRLKPYPVQYYNKDEELERLANLKSSGSLTESEYEIEKKRLLE
ncbi:superinfection immunity protein [Pseudomonas sp. 1121_17]|uniref:superinfection immunity protein n=1 Tax=Pseudomonas sp. 1121_17 TaxID=2604458 RepID=UPI0040637755